MGSDRILFRPEEIPAVIRCVVPGTIPSGIGPVRSVEVDSRKCGEGSLFCALGGERTDGHLFVGDAYAKGCRLFLVKAGVPRESFQDAVFYETADPLKALHVLARRHLSSVTAHRIGITGSNGKTTTKELVGSILSRAAKTSVNKGNLNSEIGLPLAVFEVSPDDRYAVFEMAMDHEGEMDVLTEIVRPESALVTNIGTAHVGKLGSIHAIADEKKKIFSRFTGKEAAFIPEHDDWYSFLSEHIRGKVIPYGVASTRGFQGVEDGGLDGTILKWRNRRIRLPLPGRHNVLNALGAVTLADHLGIAPDVIHEGIEQVPQLFGRSEILHGRCTIIQDCYNANPDSMSRALEFVAALPWRGRKVLVLGSMKELGELTKSAHEEIAVIAAGMEASAIFFFGDEAKYGYDALQGSDCRATVSWTADIETLIRTVREVLREGDLVLIKGSRAVALERLTDELKKTECLSGSGGSGVS